MLNFNVKYIVINQINQLMYYTIDWKLVMHEVKHSLIINYENT